MKRTVYYVSDSTGITAETLGQALLSQFDDFICESITIPFASSEESIRDLVREINTVAKRDNARPLVFCTFSNSGLRYQLAEADGLVLDLMHDFIEKMEQELNIRSSHALGHFHAALTNQKSYEGRIDAVDFAINHDDGASTRHYAEADIILIGVSRTGKTPVSVYLAIQFGIKTANYPLTDADLIYGALPAVLVQHRPKLFALSIEPQRLQQIRTARQPGSVYASLIQCRKETREAEALYRQEAVECLNISKLSIEEIASRILVRTGYRHRIGRGNQGFQQALD